MFSWYCWLDGEVEPLGELPAVPDQQFLIWLNGFDSVEVYVIVDLASDQVLLFGTTCRIHKAHPVALVNILPIHKEI